MEKILIVEDDTDINNLLAKILKKQGYEVVQAFSGTEATLRLPGEDYCLILLDLMLPGLMGEDVLVKIRETGDVPVIVLSAKSALEDRVKLLNLGADDYIMKPFEKEEIIARVNSAVRRYRKYHQKIQSNAEPDSAAQNAGSANGAVQRIVGQDNATQTKEDAMENGQDEILKHKQLTLNVREREVGLNGESLNLTGHEFDILCLLMRNPNKVFSREELYEGIWQGGYYGEDNTVNMHVSNLRRKIAALTEQEYIKTVWGIGYKLV